MKNENKDNTKMSKIYPFEEAEQYVTLLQENITRMASNSANCKNWLVAVIAGALAISFSKDNVDYAPYVIVFLMFLTLIFYFLDCLYLGLERRMIEAEKAFVNACMANDGSAEKLFMTFKEQESASDKSTKPNQLVDAFHATRSWSTSPFYGVILIVLGAVLLILICGGKCCCCCGC